jgi:hypothetical protein
MKRCKICRSTKKLFTPSCGVRSPWCRPCYASWVKMEARENDLEWAAERAWKAAGREQKRTYAPLFDWLEALHAALPRDRMGDSWAVELEGHLNRHRPRLKTR